MILVYSAMSLDGFLAGPNDELDWLPAPDPSVAPEGDAVGFVDILARTGAMVMGRRTYDVVRGFGGEWPYGDLPIRVATRRPLDADSPPQVRAVSGDLAEICAAAQAEAGARDVYLDGGSVITQALDADLVDTLILTLVPIFLGQGIAVYQGAQRRRFAITGSGRYGGMLQILMGRAPASGG